MHTVELALEGTDKSKDCLGTIAFKIEVVVEVERLTAKMYNNFNHEILFLLKPFINTPW